MDKCQCCIKIKKPAMFLLIRLLLLPLILQSCNYETVRKQQLSYYSDTALENSYKQIIEIPLPAGFTRVNTDSFAVFLRRITLKKGKTVYLYNSLQKTNQTAQYALLDISVGSKDLQQCADAVMRLRAEWLFAQEKFNEIVFYDNNHKAYQFSPPFNRNNFTKYLDKVFGMCGSASLAKQLHPVADFSSIQPGDVIIRGGFPGHAVIVMDVAENTAGEKIYMLAQSYMPAQDIHVLVNPMNEAISPWYQVNSNMVIETPEYSFKKTALMRW